MGVAGELGSPFHSEGVSEKSKGSQSLVEANEHEYIRFDCTIEKPFKGNPVFEYHLVPKDDGVKVVQDFQVSMSSFSYVMTKIFGVKKQMISTNKLGMERLKNVLESQKGLTTVLH